MEDVIQNTITLTQQPSEAGRQQQELVMEGQRAV
jgi:hypothetical protein